MTADADQEAVAEVLSALADPTRRRILDALAAHGEATATVLATELPVSRQAIVKHLAVLDRAGLVVGRREGRETRYTVLPARLGITARWMDRVADEWDTRLSAIKRLAEAAPAADKAAPDTEPEVEAGSAADAWCFERSPPAQKEPPWPRGSREPR